MTTMLCLSRTENETICIGDDIRVRILAVTDRKVRLGIDAPKDIPVHRQEVFERITASQLPDPKLQQLGRHRQLLGLLTQLHEQRLHSDAQYFGSALHDEIAKLI